MKFIKGEGKREEKKEGKREREKEKREREKERKREREKEGRLPKVRRRKRVKFIKGEGSSFVHITYRMKNFKILKF